MTERRITVNEVLRFMHHDMMNQLQLVKINLDLNRIEDVEEAVQKMATHSQNFFNINRLCIPQTTEWLHTVAWRYPALQVSVTCTIEDVAKLEWDEPLEHLLEQSVQQIVEGIDPLVEQRLSLNVFSSKTDFEITFDYEGSSSATPNLELTNAELLLEDASFSQSNWHYCIYAHKEGI